MLNIFDTHTLLMMVEQVLPATTFLRDRYFPTNAATDIFSTTDVLVEYKDGNRKLAPFVVPRKGGVAMLRDGYKVERYEPPYIAPKRSLTFDDLQKKGFGEALFSKLTPAERQGALVMKDLDEMTEMIVRREEAMVAETLLKNGCKMMHIADDLGNYEEEEIWFYDGAVNPSQYTPEVDWDAADADILGDIFAVCELHAKQGLPATDVIVSADVGAAILKNETVLKLLDNRNVNVGGIDPAKLPDGVTKIARLNAQGHVVDILQYTEIYTDDDDISKSFIPAGKAIITAPNCGRTLYGAVSQVEQSDGLFHTYTGKRIPKYFSDASKNVRELYLTSRPLMIPNHKGSWTVVNAING